MSIANRIQEMETHIGNAYTSIDNLGIDISNTNKNIYNISPLLDTFYESLPKVSGIGSSLSLSPTMVGKIKLNEIQGSSLQENTPTPDTPVEIQSVTGLQNINVCGKNLCSNAINFSGGAVYLYFNPKTISKTFTISLISDVSVNGASFFMFGGTTNLGNMNVGTIDLIANQKVTKTITLGNKMYENIQNYDICNISIYKSGAGHDTSKAVGEPQIENGSSYTPYEPYKGNTYEVNLGKNLFDKNNITTGKRLYYWQGTAELIDDANYCVSDYIKIKPNAIYTINLTMSAYTRMIFFDNNKSPLSANETNATFTTPNNTAYVRLSVPLNQLDTTQLEKGSQVTSYSEYFTPIELNKIGDYKDRIYKDNGKWYVEKNIGKVVLNGSESWYLSGKAPYTNLTNAYCLSNQNADVGSGNIDYVMSDHFSINGLAEIYTYGTTGITLFYMVNNPSEIRLAFGMGDITVADFKTWLSTHNTEIKYVLATPTYTEITNTELIEDLETLYNAKSQEGTTNISITSEDLEMLLNVSVLKGDVE